MFDEFDTSVMSGSVIRLNRNEDNGQPCLTDFFMVNVEVKLAINLYLAFCIAVKKLDPVNESLAESKLFKHCPEEIVANALLESMPR